MNEAADLLHPLGCKGVGIYLKRRERHNIDVSFAHRMPKIIRTDDLAVLIIPHDLIKRRAASFRPKRRTINDSVKIDPVFDSLQNVGT